jgi:acyl-CoA thioesterase YciA
MIDPATPDLAEPTAWQLAIRVVAMPADTNGYGDIFGGWLMSQADIAWSTLAIRVSGGRVATVAVKEFRFIAPVLVGDLVELYARTAWVAPPPWGSRFGPGPRVSRTLGAVGRWPKP